MESSGNPQAHTEDYGGYIGLYQMSELSLADIGFYNTDDTPKKYEYFDQNWTDLAHSYGIYSKDDFFDNHVVQVFDNPLSNYESVQDIAIGHYFERLWSIIRHNNCEAYDGQTLNGYKLTQSGMIAGAHLVGAGNIDVDDPKKYKGLLLFINSGGAIIPEDGNHTKIIQYISDYGDYEFPTDFRYREFLSTKIDGFTNNHEKANTLYGGSGEDILSGFGGADTISAKGGDDVLYGGAGNDSLLGGGDHDVMYGDDDDDILYGGAGRDEMHGGEGNDVLDGKNIDSVIERATDNPQSDEDDILDGGNGNDSLYGGTGDDVLSGGGGVDVFKNDGGIDRIADHESGELVYLNGNLLNNQTLTGDKDHPGTYKDHFGNEYHFYNNNQLEMQHGLDDGYCLIARPEDLGLTLEPAPDGRDPDGPPGQVFHIPIGGAGKGRSIICAENPKFEIKHVKSGHIIDFIHFYDVAFVPKVAYRSGHAAVLVAV